MQIYNKNLQVLPEFYFFFELRYIASNIRPKTSVLEGSFPKKRSFTTVKTRATLKIKISISLQICFNICVFGFVFAFFMVAFGYLFGTITSKTGSMDGV